MKKYIALFVLILIQGCNSNSNSSSGSFNNDTPSLAQISGVWNNSRTIDGLTDEMYVVIKTNNTMMSYDYLGDSYDNTANCYEKFALTISDIGGGNFLIGESSIGFEEVHISISDGNLILTIDGISEPAVRRSLLLESDFAPICT